jgi:predicted ester cyclase
MEITHQDNAAILTTIDELFNARKLEEAMKYVDADYVETNVATGDMFRGPEGFKRSAQAWIEAFPDARVEIQNQIATEDYVAMEFIGRGTHKKPLQTPNGPIAPTGNKFEVRFCEIARFKNGKVAEIRLYFDRSTMLDQLGLQGT